MSKKIFVTYKYADAKVEALPNIQRTTVRDYIDELQKLLKGEDHIYKGENDGVDLSQFKDDTIASSLKGKIFDSTVTLIVISKGMKNIFLSDNDQWMPWEISYSLKELTRDNVTSKTNALLAVILPDESGSYEYFLTYNPICNSFHYNTEMLFGIMKRNMFNLKNPQLSDCNGNKLYHGHFSYVHCVRWDFFKVDIDKYIDIALSIKDNMKDYEISKTIDL